MDFRISASRSNPKCKPIDLSIKLDTVKTGWSIVHIKGSQVIISKIYCISLKIGFVSANSEDPDEMLHYAAFHLDLHCLQKYLFGVFGIQNRVEVISKLFLGKKVIFQGNLSQ